MKLRNLAMVLCASGALMAACSDGDTGSDTNAGGTGGKDTAGNAGSAGKSGGAGTAGKGGSAGMDESAGAGNEADTTEAAGAAGMAGMIGEGGGAGASNAEKFTVTLENIAPVKAFTSSGVFNMPVGSTVITPAMPGQRFVFTVDAGRNQTLHFATMLGATNDLFFAPDGKGISLYDNVGNAIGTTAAADVTSQVFLWDAGTELNQEPFLGPDTVKPNVVNTGLADTVKTVRKYDKAVGGGFAYDFPAVNTLVQVTVHNLGGTMFEVTIYDLATAVLAVGGEATPSHNVPLAPGVWVVSGAANPLFTDGMPASALGLEALAEDGKPDALVAYAALHSGITYPASPGAWLLHSANSKPLFTNNAADYGKGLEAIAEDGKEAALGASLPSLEGYITGAVFNTPSGVATPGPILPGSKYSFTFDANPGDSLSFASMLAATNDVFFAPAAGGIPLFDANGVAISGDISDRVSLWDAGTEANEEPGIGPNTVTNQPALNTGTGGEGKVQLLSAVANPKNYVYPTAKSVLKVSISSTK